MQRHASMTRHVIRAVIAGTVVISIYTPVTLLFLQEVHESAGPSRFRALTVAAGEDYVLISADSDVSRRSITGRLSFVNRQTWERWCPLPMWRTHARHFSIYYPNGQQAWVEATVESRLRREMQDVIRAQGGSRMDLTAVLLTDRASNDFVWWGILVNTLIFGLLVWFVWAFVIGFDNALMDHRRSFTLQKGRCPVCRYNIRMLPEPRCPECGEVWDNPPAHTRR